MDLALLSILPHLPSVPSFQVPLTNPYLHLQDDIVTLSSEKVASFEPYTNYSAIAYCDPQLTIAWDCGGMSLHLPRDAFA